MRRLAEENGVEATRVLDMPYGVPESFVKNGRCKSHDLAVGVGYFGRLVYERVFMFW